MGSGSSAAIIGWIALALVATGGPAGAQAPVPSDPESEAAAPEDAGPRMPVLRFHIESKAHFRHSEENRFNTSFGFSPEQRPPGGGQIFQETVNAGDHFEVSTFTLLADAVWSDDLMAHAKVDVIDLYDRNPTSSDHNIDVDELWLRFGREVDPATLAPGFGAYLKIGKMPKFERQDDRHLESYGLVSTAFNRFEDSGVEVGVDLGRHFYVKGTATAGNPLFFRDPNALAGDNGTPAFARDNPQPNLKSGVLILYDAEVEEIDLDGDLELGGGVGARFADEGGQNGVDVLAWAYQRKLAPTVELNGTFYGGDLDLFSVGPSPNFVPASGDEKREVGGNVWLYLGGLTFFGQYVDQEVAHLGRQGIEGELAWRFDLPLVLAVGGQQLFPYIAPAVRYSRLENDFLNTAPTPVPSISWDWEKIDAGVRLGILPTIDLTVEYASNRFRLQIGTMRDNNEFLSTLRWRL
jgi:hypothetical protein